ncbi:MAG: methyltransferase domain-containing protein [Bryobacterales bacterium]|nr:methyltransferase domain-containing protein [Bryobacterales bacterium]
MPLALVTPLPPARSGIADYSAALATELGRLTELHVFSSAAALPDLSLFDAVLYQVGNNGDHDFVYRQALAHPGIVVLHEANLHHLLADLTIKRGDWDAYLRAVEFDAGAAALEYAQRVRRLEVGPDYDGVPMLRALLQRARGLIVHSNFVAEHARSNGYSGPLAVIPHGAWLPEPVGASWRERLGVASEETLIGIFGHLKPYKRITETLRAFRRLLKEHPKARMILVGEPHPDFPVARLIESFQLEGSVRLLGYAPIEQFTAYLDACDIIVNLRYPTVGESSGTMLRALGLGKPTLVSDIGAFAEFPDDVCLKVPVSGPTEEDLILEYLRYLIENRDDAAVLGARARQWVAEECAWPRVAARYLEFCNEVAEGGASPSSGEEYSAKSPGSFTLSTAAQSPLPLAAELSVPDSDLGAVVEPPVTGEEHAKETEAHLPPDRIDAEGVCIAAASDSCEGLPEEVQPSCESTRDKELTPEEEPDFSSPLDHPVAQELLSWSSGGTAREYLVEHMSRLIATLELLPDGGEGCSILEMGCYLQITPVLRTLKHYDEIRGCYLGTVGETVHRVTQSTDGRSFECTVDAFDAERDRYPYADGSFDAVLCTELFEHLGYDPMHCLFEIHRILKPGGYLVLSTPNACSLRAIAAILGHYHPGFFPAFMRPEDGKATDPRHHREYAPRELRMALEDAGFVTEQLMTAPYLRAPEPQHAWVVHLLEHYELDSSLRGECTLLRARKSGPPKNRYPDWLYYG